MNNIRDKIRGALVGTAIGDAFGAPFEGVSPSDIVDKIQHRANIKTHWGYTDDTEMMIGVAQCLISIGIIDPNVLLKILRSNYEPARGYGKGLRLALDAFHNGMDWAQVAYVAWPEGSRGNGAAARIAPIACMWRKDLAKISSMALLSAQVTHAHEEATTGAIVQAHAIAQLLKIYPENYSGKDFLNTIRIELSGRLDSSEEWIDNVARLINKGMSSLEVVKILGNGVVAHESVSAALYSVAVSDKTFESMVMTAASFGGDVDTICAMVGAQAGALFGMSGIPELWKENLAGERPGLDYIIELADKIFDIGNR